LRITELIRTGRSDWDFGEEPLLVSSKPRNDTPYEKRKLYQGVAAYLGMDPSKVPMNISVPPLGNAIVDGALC
jgi:hypothetical protein